MDYKISLSIVPPDHHSQFQKQSFPHISSVPVATVLDPETRLKVNVYSHWMEHYVMDAGNHFEQIVIVQVGQKSLVIYGQRHVERSLRVQNKNWHTEVGFYVQRAYR